ncbi:MAG: hypothetical protein DRJ10_06355 [Bacteroidetes bacterium]|nr:MAG: hypothetical protein DRJ10_06355 [Bacteroidota bacterium]
MKKITLLSVLLIALTAEIISQSCLPEGITFSNQSMIDDFQNNYPDCEIIEGKVKIKGDDISNIDGLSSIKGINGYLTIKSNPNLLNLSGLSNLTYIGGDLYIEENPQLINFIGLDSLSSIGGYLNILFNENLINFTGINNLTSMEEDIIITANNSLTDLSGLENLTSNVTYLVLDSNPVLTDVGAVQNISSISDMIAIVDNNSLVSLSGLENISLDALQSLMIKRNSLLSECAIQNICNYLSDSIGTVNISENAVGCNNQEEVNTLCYDGIPESVNHNMVTVYPNPARDFLFIDAQGSHIEEAIIYNEFGQILDIQFNSSNSINISNLLSGIYIIELKLNGLITRQVFIVAK